VRRFVEKRKKLGISFDFSEEMSIFASKKLKTIRCIWGDGDLEGEEDV
jgi:hypothetical protein